MLLGGLRKCAAWHRARLDPRDVAERVMTMEMAGKTQSIDHAYMSGAYGVPSLVAESKCMLIVAAALQRADAFSISVICSVKSSIHRIHVLKTRHPKTCVSEVNNGQFERHFAQCQHRTQRTARPCYSAANIKAIHCRCSILGDHGCAMHCDSTRWARDHNCHNIFAYYRS